MHQNNLRSIDLNLLKVLSEIERQGSVTGAAHALGLGQPAVSQSLARLRATLQDDLFVRGPNGMTPTPRMLELIGPMRTALDQIEDTLFGSQTFDPLATDTRFLVGATDYTAVMLGSRIMQILALEVPQANLSILRTDKFDAEKMLASGEVDIALGMFPKKGDWIKRRRLFSERHVCVFNPSLLTLPTRLSVEDYVAHDHLLISLDGSPSGFVDGILETLGHRRRVAITSPYFLQSAYILESLPLIATLPERFVRCCPSLSHMALRDLPFDVPSFDISAAWRGGDERNPRLAALIKVVLEAARQSD